MARAHDPQMPRTPPLQERDAFVFLPASEPASLPQLPTVPEERPPRAWTLAKTVVAVAVVAFALAGLFYALGVLVKLQLDRVFIP